MMIEKFLLPNVIQAFMICIAAAAATMLGASAIFNTNRSNPRLLAFGLAFAGGAMVYVSLVEIFNKSVESFSEAFPDKTAYFFATLAFFSGVFLIALLDNLIPNPNNKLTKPNIDPEHVDDKKHLKKVGLLAAMAITAHNFPEGMATFFSSLEDPVMGASLAFVIAIHNIPEGISIAVPVYYATNNKRYALLACLVSAIAEPLGAAIGYFLLAQYLSPFVFGGVFGFIAGVMVFLALDELLPCAKRYAQGHDTVYGMITGMGSIALSLVLLR